MDVITDAIAMMLFLYEGGVSPEEYEEVMGMKQPEWNSLPQWRHDDYKVQAKAVYKLLEDHDLLNKEKIANAKKT